MDGAKIITMTACDRYAYLSEVLAHLSRCVGISEYVLVPHVEPGNDFVVGALCAVDFMAVEPVLNHHNLGCSRNTFEALEDGFSRSDYVIHVEDDVLLAPDALQFFEYCRSYGRIDDLFSVTAFAGGTTRTPRSQDHTVKIKRWFDGWGWATWRDRWQEIRADWDYGYTKPVTPPDVGKGWDINMNYSTRGGRGVLYPLLSRSHNIGRYGIHQGATERAWYEQHRDHAWAGSVPILSEPFEVVFAAEAVYPVPNPVP